MAYTNEDVIRGDDSACHLLQVKQVMSSKHWEKKKATATVNDERDSELIRPSKVDYCRVVIFVCCVVLAVCSSIYLMYIMIPSSMLQGRVRNFMMRNLFSQFIPSHQDNNFVIAITLKNTRDVTDKILMKGDQILIPIPRDLFANGIPRIEASMNTQESGEL